MQAAMSKKPNNLRNLRSSQVLLLVAQMRSHKGLSNKGLSSKGLSSKGLSNKGVSKGKNNHPLL